MVDARAYARAIANRYDELRALSTDVGAPYGTMADELAWLDSQELGHTRPGFEFWYGGFKRVPLANTVADVDSLIDGYILSDSPHTCTNLDTVNIALRAFSNALLNRFAEIFRTLPHDAATAARLAMGMFDDAVTDAWRDRLEAVAERRGITDVDWYMIKRETEAAERIRREGW